MKKKLIGMSIAAAALSMAMSIPAFAGWVQDTNGWGYQSDNGSWVGSGWFTDPTDGAVYYLDPDGYMMTETRVEGFWLGPDGRRVEKTEAEMQREKERAERERNTASPSKEHTGAQDAATAAKSAVAAASNTRLAYQAEMKVFMDNIYISTAKSLVEKELNQYMKASTTENNLETTYRFVGSDRGTVLTSTIWRATTSKSASFVEHAFETSYVRGAITEAEAAVLDGAYKQLLVAGLGETNGAALFDQIFVNLSQGNLAFTINGSSDSGNQYVLTCGSGSLVLKVTTDVAVDTTAEEAETTDTPATLEETEEVAPVASTVVVAGENAQNGEA